jgi:methyl-accepting chemotaxis protein
MNAMNMKWKDIKLGNKLLISFGTVLALMLVLAIFTYTGIGGIMDNSAKKDDLHNTMSELEERHIDHLIWANNVNKLLVDKDVKKLHVETDPRACKFGKWYYGEGRGHAEELVPELAPYFNDIEDPHIRLHQSAVKIDEVFVEFDRELGSKIQAEKANHLVWLNQVKEGVNQARAEKLDGMALDPSERDFGQWMQGKQAANIVQEHPGFGTLLEEIQNVHLALYRGASELKSSLQGNNYSRGQQILADRIAPASEELINIYDQVITWNDEHVAGRLEADRVYAEETLEHLDAVGGIFHDIQTVFHQHLENDEKILNARSASKRRAIVLISLLSIVLGVALAYIISRAISTGILKGIGLAGKVSEGELDITIDKEYLDRQDEVGKLTNALQNMANQLKTIVSNISAGADNIAGASNQFSSTSQEISQGANEQASSAEEISSSMEEMSSNIQQNTDNAKETEKISRLAAENIKHGYESTRVAVDSMKNIAEKISIIEDIAFQTNILALNAAVEAARAGEHGKGFAVVAAEVRKLAERSKVAAEEINELSRKGVSIAEKAGTELEAMVPEIEKTANLVQEIAAASIEQNAGADQVNNAIQQLNQTTQQNAASSEEMATGAEELASQADSLKAQLSFFKIKQLEANSLNKKAVVSNIPGNTLPKPKSNGGKTAKESHSAKPDGINIQLSGNGNDEEYEQF